jgi:hypothetical protein
MGEDGMTPGGGEREILSFCFAFEFFLIRILVFQSIYFCRISRFSLFLFCANYTEFGTDMRLTCCFRSSHHITTSS